MLNLENTWCVGTEMKLSMFSNKHVKWHTSNKMHQFLKLPDPKVIILKCHLD